MHIPGSAWAFIGILAGFKVFTVAVTLWFALPLNATSHVIWAHSLPWLIFVGVPLGASFVFWRRMWRVRRKRRLLLEAEFRVD